MHLEHAIEIKSQLETIQEEKMSGEALYDSIDIHYLHKWSISQKYTNKKVHFIWICVSIGKKRLYFVFVYIFDFFFASVERLLFAHSILCETAPVSNSNHLLAETISVTQYHSFMRILLLFFFFTFFVLRALFFALHSD